ncbi:MAG: MarC family protein [Candidatus Kapaibacterium sp.]
MFSLLISFIVMLNPVALFLYLQPIMFELNAAEFRKVLIKASFISFLIYLVFFIFGDLLFTKVFQINFESFRIFGGIVLFSFAYFYIVKGQKAMLKMKESLDDLANEIALPFMVGAGTISLAILMKEQLDYTWGIITLVLSMVICFFVVMGLKFFRDKLKNDKFRIAFDKNMEIAVRLNGFFVGAIGINMINTGIRNMYF